MRQSMGVPAPIDLRRCTPTYTAAIQPHRINIIRYFPPPRKGRKINDTYFMCCIKSSASYAV